jgi:hypothetical protein
VEKITSIYSCQWKSFKEKNGLEIEAFWLSTKFPRTRPINRLTPRASLRGGYTELFRLKFTLAENPGWRIIFADANSLYGHIAINNSFPVGKYQILLPKDDIEKKITFQDGKFLYGKESMSGDAAHVTLVAPPHLFRPFLQYRCQIIKVFFDVIYKKIEISWRFCNTEILYYFHKTGQLISIFCKLFQEKLL